MARDYRKLAITISLLASVLMLVGKLSAYFLTHSAAIFSDAAESVVHGVATGFAAFSLWYAAHPPDERHPYGHGRIAYFSAGFEGALVVAAAITVVWNGVVGLIRGPELSHLGVGIAISGVLAAINLVLGLALVREGRKHNALILVANGQHVLSDMWTTVAAIIGIALVMLTGQEWLDPLAALIIGGWIMLSGFSLVRQSISGLMDAVDPALMAQLSDELRRHVERNFIAGFHQLRCRRLNDQLWVDVHVLVPGDMRASDAHMHATQVEESIRGSLPDYTVHITSHIEPDDHEAAHPDGHTLPGGPQ